MLWASPRKSSRMTSSTATEAWIRPGSARPWLTGRPDGRRWSKSLRRIFEERGDDFRRQTYRGHRRDGIHWEDLRPQSSDRRAGDSHGSDRVLSRRSEAALDADVVFAQARDHRRGDLPEFHER